MSLRLTQNVPLAPLTTLELGGPARWLTEVTDETELVAALEHAQSQGLPVFVLGGGSNVVFADAGFPGLVIRIVSRGVSFTESPTDRELMLVEAAAGEPWDALVAFTVARGLAGLECLSGIPGSVGATPIQNVGAYGQEVSETIVSVRVFDREQGRARNLDPQECGFSYRDSEFRRHPERHVILSVAFGLRAAGPAPARYPELAAALARQSGSTPPSLADVRATVLALRRRKSMVIDPADPNRRSVGSFFTNPIVSTELADSVAARAVAQGLVASAAEVPRFAAGEGKVKLAAGWLIERAGVARGWRRGAVGVSSAHALALVHHGGGSTDELLALARDVRGKVMERFGIELSPEPIVVGAAPTDRLRPAGTP